MQSDNEFQTFSQAYLRVLRDVLTTGDWVDGVTDPYSIGSEFGKNITRTKELLVYTFCVTDPRQRELAVGSKDINRPYLLANFLWSLLGTKQSKLIIPFNGQGKPLLDENAELHAAIGPHIFKQRNSMYYELGEIESRLRQDPTTRRAVFQFFSQTDVNSGAKDVPCYNHMQFFIRGKKLLSHVVMRSQNALMVLPYDFYFFSLFHEALSVRLGIEVGKMYYTANSMHIYEDKISLAECIKSSNEEKGDLIMKDFSNETIATLGSLFAKIAAIWGIEHLDSIVRLVRDEPLDEYWKTLILSYLTTGQ